MLGKRNKMALVVMAAIIITSGLLAQERWIRRYGLSGSDRAYAMELVPGGGYIVTGRTTSFSPMSFEDAFLMKVLPSGDTAYWKLYGVDGRDERAYAIDVTRDSGYIIAGFAEALDTNNADVYLVKTDAEGNLLWSRSYGGQGQDTAHSVRQTADGGYVVAGFTTSFGAGGSDCWLLKTDSEGDTLWTKTYGTYDDDAGYCVLETPDGGYMVVGSAVLSESDESDLYILKTDKDGNFLWDKAYGGMLYDDMGYSISPTFDSGYIIAGCTWSYGAGQSDVWLLKTDASGDTIWTRTLGGPGDEKEGFSVSQTRDSGYIFAGSTMSFGAGEEDFYLVKTDPWGDTLWTRTFGADKLDICYGVRETPDGGYFLAGRTRSFGSVRCDIYLIKTDEMGNVGIEERPTKEPPLWLEHPSKPFAEQITISYHLPWSSHVTIAVFDPLGRKMRILLEGPKNPGTHTLTWDGTDDTDRRLPKGVYFVRLEVGKHAETARVVIAR